VLNVLSAPTFDLSGYLELQVRDDTSFVEASRRVNRVKTLDGGVVINDGGFSDGDRTITLRWTPTSSEVEANVERLLQTYALLVISTRSGVYSAAPDRYAPGGDESSLTLLVFEKLSD
jgi:hypothetical protein